MVKPIPTQGYPPGVFTKTTAAALGSLITQGFFAMDTLALPQGESVRAGNVTFNRQGKILNVTSGSGKAIVNYHSFDIDGDETVNFNLPSATAAILNRVTGGSASQILGRLNSNGQVFLVNPAGIIFGAGSQVNVGGLVASTLNISDQDFLNGHYKFTQDPTQPSGKVINRGQITTQPGGYVVLAGGHVENTGNINAPGGSVHLAVGKQVEMAMADGVHVQVQVTEKLQDAADNVQAAIVNSGNISAATVTAQAKLADQVYRQAVNNSGRVEAQHLATGAGGEIVFAAEGKTLDPAIENTGILTASGTIGGEIAVTAPTILQNGDILAEGTAGNGGNITLSSTEHTVLGGNSTTSVRASGDHGNGGEMLIWSDGNTDFESGGLIDVRGGTVSGNGGFVEVSAKNTVTFAGQATGDAPGGMDGTILIDPTNVRIVTGGPAGAANIPASDPNNGAGESTFDPATFAGFANVNIEATNNLTVENTFTLMNVTAGNNLTLKAGNDLTVQANITTNGGNINLLADANLSGSGGAASDGTGVLYITNNSAVNSTNGNITLQGAQFRIDAGSTIDAGTGTVTLLPATNKALQIGGGTDNADTGAILDLSSQEMGRIQAGTLHFGDAGKNGGLTVLGDLNISGAGFGAYNLSLHHSATIVATNRYVNVGARWLDVEGGTVLWDTTGANRPINIRTLLAPTSATLTTNGNNSLISLGSSFNGAALTMTAQGTASPVAINGSLTTSGNTSLVSYNNNVTINGNVNHTGGGGTTFELIAGNSPTNNSTYNNGAASINVSGTFAVAQNNTKTLRLITGNSALFNNTYFDQALSFGTLDMRTGGDNMPMVIDFNRSASSILRLQTYGANSPITQAGGTLNSSDRYVFRINSGSFGTKVNPILLTNAGSPNVSLRVESGDAYISNSAGQINIGDWRNEWGSNNISGLLDVNNNHNIWTGWWLHADGIDFQTTANNGTIYLNEGDFGAQGIRLSSHNNGSITITSWTNTTVNGDIIVTGNDIILGAGITALRAPGHTITFRPNGNKAIAIGDAADGNGNDATFDINATELGKIEAGTLVIGDTGRSGGLQVQGALDVTGAGVSNYSLTLNNGGDINFNNNTFTNDSKTLTVQANGNIQNGTFTASGAGTATYYADYDGNGVGTLTLNNNITTVGGQINLHGEAIDINAAVSGGPILVRGDSVDFTGGTLNTTLANTLTLTTHDDTQSIGFGGAAGTLQITQADLATMTTGTINIGSTTHSGGINVGSIDMTGNNSHLILKTTGTITDGSLGSDAAVNIRMPNNKNLTLTGGAVTGSSQIGDVGIGDLDVQLDGASKLNVKTNNAAAYINLIGGGSINTLDVGTAGLNLQADGGPILDGNGGADNIIAGSNSTLSAQGAPNASIGNDLDALEINLGGGVLSVSASGETNGTSIRLSGITNGGSSVNLTAATPGTATLNGVTLVPPPPPPTPQAPLLLQINPIEIAPPTLCINQYRDRTVCSLLIHHHHRHRVYELQRV